MVKSVVKMVCWWSLFSGFGDSRCDDDGLLDSLGGRCVWLDRTAYPGAEAPFSAVAGEGQG